MIRQHVLLITLPMVILAGCSRALTTEEAKRTVQSSSLLRPTDSVAIDALSPTSDTESVVHATINGRSLNLKFRRFDKGWTWEFVETRAGGWVAPDIAVAQIREEDRTVEAKKWADANNSDYASTAKTIDILNLFLPNPTMREPGKRG